MPRWGCDWWIRSGHIRDGKSEHWYFGISELKWTGMGKFNSDNHNIYYCGQESLRRNGVVNKRVLNAVLWCNLKNDRMISVRFQGKPFNITVIQVYALSSNAEEAEVEWLVLWRPTRPTRTNTKKRCSFHYRGLKYKNRKSRDTWSNRQIWPWSTEWNRAKQTPSSNNTREDSWGSLGLQGDPTSPFWRKSALGFLWKEWC